MSDTPADKLTFDPDSLTVAEVEDFEARSQTLYPRFVTQALAGQATARQWRTLAWLLMRRDDPAATWESLADVRFAQLVDRLEFAEPDPTGAAGETS